MSVSMIRLRSSAGRSTRRVAVAAFSALLAGCAGATSNAVLTGDSLRAPSLMASSHAAGTQPPNCTTPSIWAETDGGTVVGLNDAGATCITLTTANGISFLQVSGLATDSNGYLYVADTFRDRVVVFDQHGNYWSTLNIPTHAPIGVCVTQNGLVGVVPNGNAPITIDFFTNKGPLNATLNPSNQTTYASGGRFCAFDHSGDFFVAYSTQIGYLRHNHVNTANATFHTCNVAICSGGTHFWNGMYSHIMTPVVDTLSVEDINAPDIVNFQINDNPPNLLTFVPWSTPITALTNAQSQCSNAQNGFLEIAPTTGSGNTSKIYLGCVDGFDFVRNVVTGGPVHILGPVGTFGVATHPTGQY